MADSVAMSAAAPLHGKKLTQKQVETAGTTIFSVLFILALILTAIVWYLAANSYKTAAVVVGCYFGSGLLASALLSGDALFYAEAKKDNIYVATNKQMKDN